MTELLAGVFTSPMSLTGIQHAWALLPLCLSISIVYKTTRCETVRQIPLAALVLWVTIVLGMYAVGIGLWILHRIMM